VRQLLEYASWLLDSVDPRNAGIEESGTSRTLDDLIGSYLDVATAESSALLTALATLHGDEDLRSRIAAEVGRRGDVLPEWLAELHNARVIDRAVQITEPLEDGVEFLVGVELAGGEALSMAAFIDNNLNAAVKDALVAPRPLDDTARELQAAADDSDLVFSDIPAADARAHIVAGVEAAGMLVPPVRTDSWPAKRPLLEWLVSLLPPGGTGRVLREWSDEELDALIDRFFESPSGQRWSRSDVGSLVEDLVYGATEDAAHDPLLISPVWVEIAIRNVLPNVDSARDLSPDVALDVFRDLIRFGHAERGVREGLTEATLRYVDRFAEGLRSAAEG